MPRPPCRWPPADTPGVAPVPVGLAVAGRTAGQRAAGHRLVKPPQTGIDRHVDANVEVPGAAQVAALVDLHAVHVGVLLAGRVPDVQRGDELLARDAGVGVSRFEGVGVGDRGPGGPAPIPEVPPELRGRAAHDPFQQDGRAAVCVVRVGFAGFREVPRNGDHLGRRQHRKRRGEEPGQGECGDKRGIAASAHDVSPF